MTLNKIAKISICITLLISILAIGTGCKEKMTFNVLSQEDFMREDPGVIEARVKVVGGVPRLFIDGQAVAPVMFSALYGYGEGEAIKSQIRKAGENQTDIIRIVISIMGNIAQDMGQYVDSAIDMVLANNPDALILLTYGVHDNPSRLKGGSAEFDAFKDQNGTTHTFSSLTSRAWLQQYMESTQALVEYVISNPEYADKVIGYQPAAGSAGEWFGPMYFEGLVDHSESNSSRFREFLIEKYKNISALRSAWGDGSLDFDTVTVPANIPGSGLGEIRNPLDYTIIITPENQKYIDYEDHYSAVLADAIAQICEVIKEASDGRSIAMSYFGYHSEVRTPFSGSFGLYKLLDCEYIDALSAPVSYGDRNSGGIGAFMSPVNSIHNAGKLWFDECDYRTPNRTSEGFFPGGTQESVSFMPEIDTLEDVSGVLKRQAGKAMVYGSGYWWLDLIYRGWFDYDEFWEENNELSKLYIDYMKYKTGEAPDVAIVYDERAFNMLGQPWQIGSDMLADMRGLLYTAGYSFGYFSIDDIIGGAADGSSIYYVLTPWRMTEQQVEGLKSKFYNSAKTVVWVYGFGTTDKDSFSELTGMNVVESRTPNLCDFMYSGDQISQLADLKNLFVTNRDTKPWYKVEDPKAKTIAFYDGTENVSVALSETNGYRSIFYGATVIPEKTYRAFNDLAQTHCFLDSQDTLYADDALVVVHAKSKGEKTIRFPKKCDVYDHFEDKWYKNIKEITVDMDISQTRFFFYGNMQDLQYCNIGSGDVNGEG